MPIVPSLSLCAPRSPQTTPNYPKSLLRQVKKGHVMVTGSAYRDDNPVDAAQLI